MHVKLLKCFRYSIQNVDKMNFVCVGDRTKSNQKSLKLFKQTCTWLQFAILKGKKYPFSMFQVFKKSFYDILGLLESIKCQSEPFASKSCEGLIVNLLCATSGRRTKVLHTQVQFRSLVFFLIFQRFIIKSGVKNRKLRETILIWLLLKLGPNSFYVCKKEVKLFLTKLNQSLKLKPSFVNRELVQHEEILSSFCYSCSLSLQTQRIIHC